MKKTATFTILRQPEPVATMIPATAVKAIALAWRIRTGSLEAPPALVATGNVLVNTRLNFGSSIGRMIEAIDSRQPAGVTGILFAGKLPFRVVFGSPSCFGDCEILSHIEGAEAAYYFVEKGYSGQLLFSPTNMDDQFHRSCQCRVILPDDHDSPVRLRIETDDERHLDRLEQFFEICKKLGLKEPEEVTA